MNDWLELSGRLSRSFDDKPETGVQKKVVELEWRRIAGEGFNTKTFPQAKRKWQNQN